MGEFTNISTAAKNYADALIDLANDNKIQFEKLSEDLKTVYKALEDSSALRTVLSNPVITDDVKSDILKSIFWGKVSQDVVNFLLILVEKKRITEFPQIYAEYKLKLYEVNNIQPITVISAVELNNDVQKSVTDCLSEKLGKTILPKWEVDSGIIAGLIVKVNDNVADMSIKGRINSLYKSLILK